MGLWTARDRTVVAKTEQYLDRSVGPNGSYCEELELLLCPEDAELDLRYLLMSARRKKGGGICERVVYRHGAILFIVRECSGFIPRNFSTTWMLMSRTENRQTEREKVEVREKGRRQSKDTTNAQNM